jgi:hypothetical protein
MTTPKKPQPKPDHNDIKSGTYKKPAKPLQVSTLVTNK